MRPKNLIVKVLDATELAYARADYWARNPGTKYGTLPKLTTPAITRGRGPDTNA